jgi:muramoyltetrapeptide carboxypeptidase
MKSVFIKAIIIILVFMAILNNGDYLREKPVNLALSDPQFFDALKGIGITLVAPASKTEEGNLIRLTAYLNSSLDVSMPEDIQGAELPYHANSDDKRAELLIRALSAGDNKVTWALRGGYGSARLLRYLENSPVPAQRKLFVGYSDMTFVHLFLSQKWQWPSIHGAMAAELLSPLKNPRNFLLLGHVLSGKQTKPSYNGLVPLNEAARNVDKVHGKVTGGNLTLLSASLATSWQLEANNKILIIEDVFSDDNASIAYQIDRDLTHLEQAGVFKSVAAVIFGTFKSTDKHVDFSLNRFANAIDAPVFQASWFGHGEDNYPIVLNWDSAITCNDSIDGKKSCSLETDLTSLVD